MSAAKEEILTMPTPTNPPPQPTTHQPIHIRRSRLYEGHHVGRIAACTYYNTELTKYLSPYNEKYYGDYEYGFQTRAQARMFSTRQLTYFAYEENNPGDPIGYVQFVRLGDDEAARKMDDDVGVTWRICLVVLNWLFGIWVKANWWWRGGNKSEDLGAVMTFLGMMDVEEKLHWTGREDRKNRWHAQSVCILPEYQGRGVGKRLMAEVLGWADSEGVITGIESSAAGEWMYRSVGFELLARYRRENNIEGEGGGVMIRMPGGRKLRDLEK